MSLILAFTPGLLQSNEPRCEKTVYCICENKEADQLCGNCTADQRLYFRYTDSAIPLLPIYEIKPLAIFCSYTAWLCETWSETPKTGFLRMRLKYICIYLGSYLELKNCLSKKMLPNCHNCFFCSQQNCQFKRTETCAHTHICCEKTGLRGFRPGPTQTGL